MMKSRLLSAGVYLIFNILSINAHAATLVFIDDFNITKNSNTTFFQDTFGNNIAPPDTGGNSQSYRVIGGPLGSEAGGKLTLSAANGEAVTRPDAGAMTRQGARVQTNINPLQPTNGLRTDDFFSVTGVFDIAIPTVIRERYGVRLTDNGSTVRNDSIGISVMRTSVSLVEVVLHHYDRTAFTFTDLEKFTLDASHDQIVLTLSRLDTANNNITASFSYIDSGIMGATTTFTTTPTIFNGEDHTRAVFMHLVPVDSDDDDVSDTLDNCTNVANPGQEDSDGDGHGNACDGDFNNDCSTNIFDLFAFKGAFGSSDPADAQFDLDNTGGPVQVNIFDLFVFKGLFGSPPGQSPVGSLCNP